MPVQSTTLYPSLTVAHARKICVCRFLLATAANVTIPVRFLNTDMNMGSLTAGVRALSFNLLYLGKYTVKIFLCPDQCSVCAFMHGFVVDGLLSLSLYISLSNTLLQKNGMVCLSMLLNLTLICLAFSARRSGCRKSNDKTKRVGRICPLGQ